MTKNQYREEMYVTSDLALAAYLMGKHQMLEAKKVDDKRYGFFFNRSSDLDNDVEDFYNNLACVSPLQYFNNTKMLKARIYSTSE